MKKTLAILSGTTACLAALGQCTTTIPANTAVVASENFNVLLDQNTNFWLCDNSMAQLFMGANNHFWIEAGGGNNSINSNGNTIYYKGTYPMDVTGNNNTVYAMSEGVVELQGANNTVITCPDGVEFDYGEAPANGCMDFTGIGNPGDVGLSVLYDMVSDRVQLIGAGSGVNNVRLLDMTGRELWRMGPRPAMEWSMARYPAGHYIVQATTGNKVLAKGFVKP